MVVDFVHREIDELAAAGHGVFDRVVEALAEGDEIAELRHARRAEQASCGVVLQRDRVVGVQGKERHRDVLDQRAQAPHFEFLVGACRLQAAHDVAQFAAELAEAGAEAFEIETLGEIRVPRGVQETRELAVRAAHGPPQFRRGQQGENADEERHAVIARRAQHPDERGNQRTEQHEAHGQCHREAPIGHAFPCAGTAMRASAPVPAPRARY